MRTPSTPGQIIILNGQPRAGKTSIGRALQRLMDEPYLLFGGDLFLLGAMDRTKFAPNGTRAEVGFHSVPIENADPPERMWTPGAYEDLLFAGFHQSIAGLSHMGHNVIADHLLVHPRWIRDCAARLACLPTLFVGVDCSSEKVMERRNIGNDGIRLTEHEGRAVVRWWSRAVETPGVWDLRVNTSLLSPEECADVIRKHLNDGPQPTAFRQLARQLGVDACRRKGVLA